MLKFYVTFFAISMQVTSQNLFHFQKKLKVFQFSAQSSYNQVIQIPKCVPFNFLNVETKTLNVSIF